MVSIRHTLCLFIVMLFSAFGTNAAVAMQVVTSELIYPQTEATGGDCAAGLAAGVAQSLYAGYVDRNALDKAAATETAAVLAKIQVVGEAANLVVTWVDDSTGNVVSSQWNEIPQETRDAIIGGTKVVTFVIPAGVAGKVAQGLKAAPDIDPPRTGNVIEGEVGPYGDLAARSVRDGMTPDHIPSYASVERALDDLDIELTPDQLKAIRSNTNCIVVQTCDHQTFSRTYGGRNNQGQIQTDANDLYRAAEADLDTWEPVWRNNGWSDSDIANARQQVHLHNEQTFGELGLTYGSN